MGPLIHAVEVANGGVAELGFGYIAAPTPTSAALATLHGDVFVAMGTGTPGRIEVLRLPGFSATPSVRTELLPSGYQGTRIALAAAGQHVSVAWLNEIVPVSGGSPGGWALLGCAE
jgi:hypothetical protein